MIRVVTPRPASSATSRSPAARSRPSITLAPTYVRAQIEFGRHDGGRGFWGDSPACRPGGEYGVPLLGTRPGGDSAGDTVAGAGGAPAGHVVTPHASFLALPFAAAEAMVNLAALAGHFPVYRSLGFDSASADSSPRRATRPSPSCAS